ncbi:MAG: hypothetical protein IKT68_01365 [Clostridia bacterium]|nr:hypothetical protein [Clostridia bacterium]
MKKSTVWITSVCCLLIVTLLCGCSQSTRKKSNEPETVSSSDFTSIESEQAPTYPVPTDRDWETFTNMCNSMMYGWNGLFETGDTIDFAATPVSTIITQYIFSQLTGMYRYFAQPDTNPETGELFWINYNAVDNQEYLDPLKQFFAFSRLDAKTVDWIAENVFGAVPNRNETNNQYYYYNDKVYCSIESGGGPGYYYEIVDKKDFENGQYGVTVDVYEDVSEYEADPKVNTIYFTTSLQEDSQYGRYWKFEKATVTHRMESDPYFNVTLP